MGTRSIKRVVAVALIASATVLGTVEAAAAQTTTTNFDAGVACEFPLTLVGSEDTRTLHELTDANGNAVQLLTGRGSAITLTNDDTGATLALQANGAPWRIVNRPDGTSTYTTMGHLVLIMFPSDVPAGPSTTLYVGQRRVRRRQRHRRVHAEGGAGQGHGPLRGALELSSGRPVAADAVGQRPRLVEIWSQCNQISDQGRICFRADTSVQVSWVSSMIS